MQSDDRIKQLTSLGLCLFVVPILGWMTGDYVEREYDTQFRDAIVAQKQMLTDEEYAERVGSYTKFCASVRAGAGDDEASSMCAPADLVWLAKSVAIGTVALGVLVFLLILGGRAISGTDRQKLSRIFGPLVRVVMILLAISIFAQGAIFVYTVYTLEAIAIERVHIWVLLAIALGALFACWVLVRNSLGYLKSEPMLLRGALLDRKEQPQIYQFVDGIAARLRAEKPDQIIVGLEPNFFVTSSRIRMPGTGNTVEGKSLFVSLALMRLLTEAELAAVVGHELGHFRGNDIAYSMKFATTYARLWRAIGTLGADSGSTIANIAKLPAVIALGVCLLEFAAAERTVGRERELVADQAGAEASSADALARALVKVALYGPQWGAIYGASVEAMAEGKEFANLSSRYVDGCSQLRDTLNWEETRQELGRYVQPHPVDTHPPLITRLGSLGASVESMTVESIAVPERSAAPLIQGADRLEESLSALEARWLAESGIVSPSKVTTDQERDHGAIQS